MDLRLPLFIILALLAGATTYFVDLESGDAALLFFTIAFFGVVSMFGKLGRQRALTARDIEMQLRYHALELPKDDRVRVNGRLERGDVIGAVHDLCAAYERNEIRLNPDRIRRLELLLEALGMPSELLEPIRMDGPSDTI